MTSGHPTALEDDAPRGPHARARARVASAGRQGSRPAPSRRRTFDGSVWTLRRETADFTPLAFAPRFTGTFAQDGRTIDGAWETRRDDAEWELDFPLVYARD